MTDNYMVNVKDYGASGNGITDDTAAINTAFGNASGKTVYIPDGTYCISSTLTVPADVSLFMAPNAVLKATAVMDVLLDTTLAVRRINREIRGGVLECNHLVATGFALRYFWGGYIENIIIKNPTQIFMKIGDSAAQTGQIENGEITIRDIRGERDRQFDVPTGSIGVLFENVYDSMISNCTITGAEVGFRVSSNASMVMSQCHAWNYISGHPDFGGLKIAFDLLGAGCQLFQCYADTVTQTGYHIGPKGLVSLTDCKTYTNNVGPDNIATCVYIEPHTTWCSFNSITNMKLNGSDTNHRLLKDYDGDLSLTSIVNTTRINVSNIASDRLRSDTGIALGCTYDKPLYLNTSYRYWIDSEGELRFKNSAPSGATDGDRVSGTRKVTALPSADVTQRGRLVRIEGGPGTADGIYVCVKLANDTHSWARLA